ncbi:hypothetical protein J7J58_02580 [candidate division WOR-3 bacterium]|nr:hypothetical protein [candidate division WOR-3 bacterium]
MNVKGSAVISTIDFVNDKFPKQYNKWLDSLPPTSKDILAGNILPSMWYPLKESFIIPTQKLCEMFYNGDSKGAWEVGRYSADLGLKKFYRIFLKFGSPHFLIKRASSIFSLYYENSKIISSKEEDKLAILRITEFQEPHELVESRIAGWIERALELTKGHHPVVRINKSLAREDDFTEISISWS